jgi:hypothetical protein
MEKNKELIDFPYDREVMDQQVNRWQTELIVDQSKFR